MAERKDWTQRLRRIAIRSFPLGARVLALPAERELMLAISWTLGPAFEPDKRSKTLRLVILENALLDYDELVEGERRAADRHLERHLKQRVLNFDRVHQRSSRERPPLVRWQIGSLLWVC